MIVAPELLGPMKGVGLAGRAAARMFAAGAGGAAGSVVNDTLVNTSTVRPPPTLTDIGTHAVGAFQQGFEGEGIAAGISRAATGARNLVAKYAPEALRAPLAGKVAPAAREAIERGIPVTPGQATGARPLHILENIMEGSLAGGGKYEALLKDQAAKFGEATQQELNQFGISRAPERMGMRVQVATRAAERQATSAANELYDAHVWPLAESQGVEVPLTSLRQYTDEELAKRGLVADVAGGRGVQFLRKVAGLSTPVKDQAAANLEAHIAKYAQVPVAELSNPKYTALLQSIAEQAGIPINLTHEVSVPFRAAHYMRSAANDLAHTAGAAGDAETAYYARQIYGRLDDAMETSATAAGGDLAANYQKATKAWRDLRTTFSDSVAEQVLKAEPRQVVDTIIKPHRVADVQKLRDTVGDQAWHGVARSFAEKLVDDPGAITEQLHKYGKETLDAVFPRGTADGLWQLGRIADTLKAKGVGTGKMWISLTQASAAVGLLMGRQPTSAAAVLLTPLVLSHILTTPMARQWLTTGLRATAAGDRGAAAKVTGQLLSWLINQKLVDGPGAGKAGGSGTPASAGTPPVSSGRGGGPGPRASGPPAFGPPPTP